MRAKRLPKILLSILLVITLLTVGQADGSSSPDSLSSPNALGVHLGSGSNGVNRLPAYESWLGGSSPWVLDFIADSWASIDNPGWWINQWAPTGRRVVYSIPMLPPDHTLEAGAQGQYNDHWRRLAQTFVSRGAGDAILRLGWEFNGKFYTWSAVGKEAAYAAYWRQIVNTIRSVPGADFSFDWTFMGGGSAVLENAYPGDAYVDVIGIDAYDQTIWRPALTPEQLWNELVNLKYGLQWHRNFAAAHNKPVSFPEWGVWAKTLPVTREDNPHYIRSMHNWFETSNLAYAMYFEYNAGDGYHKLSGGLFPKSAAAFRELFSGGLGTSPSPTTTIAPTTTTTVAPTTTVVPTTTTTVSPTTTTTVLKPCKNNSSKAKACR